MEKERKKEKRKGREKREGKKNKRTEKERKRKKKGKKIIHHECFSVNTKKKFAGGGGEHCGFCHRRYAVINLLSFLSFLIKRTSQVTNIITQGTGQSSIFFTFRIVFNFRGRTWAFGNVGGGRGGIPGLHSLYEAWNATSS